MLKLLGCFALLVLVGVVSTKQTGQKRQRNPWLIHKGLLPDSKIKCQIPWRKCATLKNCTARLKCVHQHYKCIERDQSVVVTPSPSTNTTASNQGQLMNKCKDRINKCLTKKDSCKRKVSCILFRIYQCERLQGKNQRPSKLIPKKKWAIKIKKKIQRKKKRIMKLTKKNRRKNKRRSRKGKRNRKRSRKRKRKP